MSGPADDGGFWIQSSNVRRGSAADTTARARMVRSPLSVTPMARPPSTTIDCAGVLVAITPPRDDKALAKLADNIPLPPTGRPTCAAWRNANVSAPSPVPGSSGDRPHTTGPVARAGVNTRSSPKNERITPAALMRLHFRRLATPRPRLASTDDTRARRRGPAAAAESTSRATGTAAAAYRR